MLSSVGKSGVGKSPADKDAADGSVVGRFDSRRGVRLRRRDRRPQGPGTGEVGGRARVGGRTKDLTSQLEPGEVAVVDHLDLDRVAAEGLVRARPSAVVNASRSVSGRYPNLGPLLLVAAGIPLIDEVGSDVMTDIANGQWIEVDGTDVCRGGVVVASGVRHTLESLEEQIEVARHSIGGELERFAENTLEYMLQERHLLTDSPDLPALTTSFAGRHVLIVVRGGADAAADLGALNHYIEEMRPIMVGVDGGADVILAAGHRPDLIVGDFDSVTTAALMGSTGRGLAWRSGLGLPNRNSTRPPELLLHAFPDGQAPGAARLETLGLSYVTFEALGTSEDVAMLVAYEKGAELIVAVGTHASMVEFMDKGRSGMASTFLVRLKVGPILVDAKGVSRLYQSRVRTSDMMLLVAAALFAMFVMVAAFQPLHVFIRAIWFSLVESWRAVVGG